jgi:hypothetical protein
MICKGTKMAISTQAVQDKLLELCRTPQTQDALWQWFTRRKWTITRRTLSTTLNAMSKGGALQADGMYKRRTYCTQTTPAEPLPAPAFPPLRSIPRVRITRAGGWNAERMPKTFYVEDVAAESAA